MKEVAYYVNEIPFPGENQDFMKKTKFAYALKYFTLAMCRIFTQ